MHPREHCSRPNRQLFFPDERRFQRSIVSLRRNALHLKITQQEFNHHGNVKIKISTKNSIITTINDCSTSQTHGFSTNLDTKQRKQKLSRHRLALAAPVWVHLLMAQVLRHHAILVYPRLEDFPWSFTVTAIQ